MGGSGHQQGPFDLMYFLKGALAGGICCGVTHGALTPVDVVKTRIQLEPKVFNKVRPIPDCHANFAFYLLIF